MKHSLRSGNIRHLAYDQVSGEAPGIVFLGGFRSDKEGIKARHLERWAIDSGRAYLRFDYSGHGRSSGDFLEGCIGDWAEDAAAIISDLTEGPQILVGSSMGGWISLLIAREMPNKVAGLVTVAAAPDFTEDSLWASLSDGQKSQLLSVGQITMHSEYSTEPYIITRLLIENGRKMLVLRSPLHLPFPTRFLHGTADQDVDVSVALGLLEHAEGVDIRLILVKGADHRFSSPSCLDLITRMIDEVTASIRG
jgi:pimeloyl-ACP methyl ester carboxylesterase